MEQVFTCSLQEFIFPMISQSDFISFDHGINNLYDDIHQVTVSSYQKQITTLCLRMIGQKNA